MDTCQNLQQEGKSNDSSEIENVLPLYSIQNIGKEYISLSEKVTVFQDITFEILQGETIAIVGASGVGKSSFLHILGSLAMPSWGNLLFNGEDILHASEQKKAILRNQSMGFVFQFHHLLPEFSTLENVAMPGIISGMAKEEAFAEAASLLDQVGLKNRASFNVTLLSGGERQRVAIARALFKRPLVLLADEPTGNLDEKNGRIIADLMLDLNTKYKMAMIVVTHNPELAARMDRCLELKSGDLYDQKR